MKKILVLFVSIFALISMGWRCQKENSESLSASESLKNSINTSVDLLSSAVNTIKQSDGYAVITLSDVSSKSSDSFWDSVNIELADIAGVYNYKPVEITEGRRLPFIQYFEKTEENALCIVRLPQSKMAHPRSLFRYQAADSNLVNNYIVTVSDYQYKNIFATSVLYRLAADINVDGTDAGQLKIDANADTSSASYTSSYNFGNGLIASTSYTSGDTAISKQTITKDGVVLYEESLIRIKSEVAETEQSGYHHRKHHERNYILTIGDVTIKRMQSQDSAQVYLAGVLQENATIEIIDDDTDSDTPSVCKNRSVKITFDDGSSVILSELANSLLGDVATIFSSLRSVYFASDIVDMIAANIFRTSQSK